MNANDAPSSFASTQVCGNLAKALPVWDIVNELSQNTASAADFLPPCFARWAKQHQLHLRTQMPSETQNPQQPTKDMYIQPQHTQLSPGDICTHRGPSKLNLAPFPRCQELVHMVRACSLVATETPLMVLHQFAGRLKLELTFHESNGGCESPFAARVRLRSTASSSGQPQQKQQQHSVLAEATGVVSLLPASIVVLTCSAVLIHDWFCNS